MNNIWNSNEDSEPFRSMTIESQIKIKMNVRFEKIIFISYVFQNVQIYTFTKKKNKKD